MHLWFATRTIILCQPKFHRWIARIDEKFDMNFIAEECSLISIHTRLRRTIHNLFKPNIKQNVRSGDLAVLDAALSTVERNRAKKLVALRLKEKLFPAPLTRAVSNLTGPASCEYGGNFRICRWRLSVSSFFSMRQNR